MLILSDFVDFESKVGYFNNYKLVSINRFQFLLVRDGHDFCCCCCEEIFYTMDRTSSVVEIADLDKETIPSTMASDGDEDADLHKSCSSSTFCMERSPFLMSTPVNESQESVHDDDTHNRSTLIFKEKLVNHLTYKTVKGKVKLKWTGLLRELKEFVVLILEKMDIGIQGNKVGSKLTCLIMQSPSSS